MPSEREMIGVGWGITNDEAPKPIMTAEQMTRAALGILDKHLQPLMDTERERGMKNDFSKPQYSLLPLKDLEGVVRVLEHGAEKYARGDWKHVPNGAFRYLDAAMRHLSCLSDCDTIEQLRCLDDTPDAKGAPPSMLPHIDHAICSLIFARHFIFKEKSDGQ